MQAYSFNHDKTLIPANQGHSIPVDVALEKLRRWKSCITEPEKNTVNPLSRQALFIYSRLYVYLSSDIDTAI